MKLTVAFSNLTDNQRHRIEEACRKHSVFCEFYASDAEAIPHASDSDIILGGSRALSVASHNLKWFCAVTAGVEPFLDLPENVILTNSSGAFGVTISEHIVMSLLQLMRRDSDYQELVRKRIWKRDLAISSICQSRITLLGTGNIGTETSKRLRAFSPMSIVGVNRSGKDNSGLFDKVFPVSELKAVLPETDVLICSLPDTPETRNLMSAEMLELLPQGAFIVNVGRGSLLDEDALLPLLSSGHIAGAALDVFRTEPIPQESKLWDFPGLLITPHISGNTMLPYTRELIIRLFLEDFENYFADKPLLRFVDRKMGY